jgi:hypothetical protein
MNQYFSIFSFALITSLACLILTGCGNGGRPADLPKLTSCELAVQFEDGLPVSDAMVMLYPLNGKWYSNGKTDSKGRVKVAVNGSFSGVVPGEYKVTVKKQEIAFPPGYDPEGDNENLPDATITDLVAREFSGPAATPLKLIVTETEVRETLTVKKAVSGRGNKIR